jgi:sirohydrochlorin ferrochelatase
VRALRPGLQAHATYLQFTTPSVTDALVDAGGDAVVVPLLLSTGYHLRVDLPAAVRDAHEAVATPRMFSLGPALGPHPLLVDALRARLRTAGWRPGMPVVLAAAGSSDPRSTADVWASARTLSDRIDVPVVAGFASGTTPTIADAVASLRAEGAERIAVASYLIAPGQFHDLATCSGADVVAAPLADHLAMARLVLHRYDEAVRSMSIPVAANARVMSAASLP